MDVRALSTLGVMAVLSMPAAAESRGSSHTIDELKVIARSVHPTLDSVEAGIEQARGVLRGARAYPNPDLALTGGRGRPRDGGDSRSEWSLAWVQPIELPGVRKWRSRVAELDLEGAGIERMVARSAIDGTVARLAYTVVGEQRRVAIARESALIAERLNDLLARRLELGESAPLDALRARGDWFARRRSVIDAEASLVAARQALDVFCGRRLGATYEVVVAPAVTPPPGLPVDLVALMKAGNPVVRGAEISVERSEARIESERHATLPRVDLVAAHDEELDRVATSLGVALTIPLWNRNRGVIGAATADRRRAASQVEVLLAELETELSRAAAEYGRARAAIELYADGWTAAVDESLRVSTFSFENGEASLLEVLDAQRSNLEVRLAEADAWTALNLARAEIERLIGARIGGEP